MSPLRCRGARKERKGAVGGPLSDGGLPACLRPQMNMAELAIYRSANESCQTAAREAEEVRHLGRAPCVTVSLRSPAPSPKPGLARPARPMQARRILGPGLPAVDPGLLDAAKKGLFVEMLFGG